MKNIIIFATIFCLGLLACKSDKSTNDCKGKANPAQVNELLLKKLQG
jgi:hypothetical protein